LDRRQLAIVNEWSVINIWGQLTVHSIIITAKYENHFPLAGKVQLSWNRTVIYKYRMTLSVELILCPTERYMWERTGMELCITDHYKQRMECKWKMKWALSLAWRGPIGGSIPRGINVGRMWCDMQMNMFAQSPTNPPHQVTFWAQSPCDDRQVNANHRLWATQKSRPLACSMELWAKIIEGGRPQPLHLRTRYMPPIPEPTHLIRSLSVCRLPSRKTHVVPFRIYIYIYILI